MADLYFNFGRYKKSEPLYLRALKIREDIGVAPSNTQLDIAVQLEKLARYGLRIYVIIYPRLKALQGKYFDAETFAKKAQDIFSRVALTGDVSSYFSSLAVVQYEHGK